MQTDLFDRDRDDVLRATTYGDLRERLAASNCVKCELAGSRTRIVVDRGVPGTGLMAIGEGPGQNEDLQGAAFVGRAGQLFDKIMAAIRIDTNRDMLIANVVKCRPPENRTPTAREAKTCMPYLQRQVALARPEIILLLGATSLRHLDPRKKSFSMADEAGRLLELDAYPGMRFMVLYHPAALLYNAKLKPAMWDHVRALRSELDGLGIPRRDEEAAPGPRSVDPASPASESPF